MKIMKITQESNRRRVFIRRFLHCKRNEPVHPRFIFDGSFSFGDRFLVLVWTVETDEHEIFCRVHHQQTQAFENIDATTSEKVTREAGNDKKFLSRDYHTIG